MRLPFIRLRKSHAAWLALIGMAITATVAALSGNERASPQRTPASAPVHHDHRVVARGRIEPASRVRTLQLPAGAIVQRVFVHEGDRVKSGSLLAITDQHASMIELVALEERRLVSVESELRRVSGPAKQAQLESVEATIRVRRAELEQATSEHKRIQALIESKLVSQREAEDKRLAMEKTAQALAQAEAELRSLLAMRDVDTEVAKAQIGVQRAALARARAELEMTEVRASIDGTILVISAREGESPMAEGFLQMADLSHLVVVAEVDESDVVNVSAGQKAELTIGSLQSPINGTVARVANSVFKQKRPTSDVLIGRDARIVEVEITPDTPLPAVIGAEVSVIIAVH